jgi:hypothetical protein
VFARYSIFDIRTMLTSYNEPYTLDINSNTNLDSIMKELKVINEKRQYYFCISFYGLNEIQLDEFCSKFFFREYVAKIDLFNCPIKVIPLSFREFNKLHYIGFHKCNNIESMENVNYSNPIFLLSFERCNISRLPKGIENWKSMLYLKIGISYDYYKFDLDSSLVKFSNRNNVMNLLIYYKNLKEFPKSLFELTALRHLTFYCNPKIKLYKTNKLINLVELETNLDGNNLLDEKVFNNLQYYTNFNKMFSSVDSIPDYFRSDFIRSNSYYDDKIDLYRNEGQKLQDSALNAVWMKISNYEFQFSPWVEEYKIDGYKFNFTYKPDDRFFKIMCKNIKNNDKINIIIKDSYTSEEFMILSMKNEEEYTIDLTKYPNYYFDMIFNINGKSIVYKLRVGK